MKSTFLFGERLKQARLAAGLSQIELGEKIETSGAFVCMLERGRRTASHLVLSDICKVLGCSMDYLVNGTEEEHRNLKIGGW